MLLPLSIFFATYALMLALPGYRHIVALASAALFVALGILPPGGVLPAVDFNVILMLAGTMAIVSLFIESNMPQRIADILLARTKNVCRAIVALAVFAGIISAFVDNVATLLIVAPVGLAIAKKLKIPPIPVLISIAVSSNLQGAATLVGDTTSILLGGYAKLDFLDFFVFRGRPGIFWAVELGALATTPVIYMIFRRYRDSVPKPEIAAVSDYFPSVLLVGLVALLICASFIPDKPEITNGLICAALGAAGTVRAALKRGSAALKRVLREIDYVTLLLLAGLFVVIAGITEAGVIDAIGDAFVRLSAGSVFGIYTLLVFGSVIFSAFIDNIPYVATMLPVVTVVSDGLGADPTLLYFGLLVGATLGGNLTPIGASANITAIGILRREGYEVRVRDFVRIGAPFTLVAVTVGYIFVWFVWRQRLI
ncbi:MAG: arsenic transporter [Oscillospiraceae bacterium]|jgi:Na+/H+ antiporter NhaD/arsenite permease-like protein|nr:arsenic transporter [Oscillospiraceae bacterium]